MSALARETRCFHCRAPITGAGFPVSVEGEHHLVCSEACGSAAAEIERLRLGRYYEYRDRFDKGDTEREGISHIPRKLQDREMELAGCVTPAKGGSVLNVRVPDIRCAACTWLIENSLGQRDDVVRCGTNLADRRVTVEFSGKDPMPIVSFIEGLGFTVLPDRVSEAQLALDKERKSMLARLGVAGIGMMQVMMYAIATYVAGDAGIQPAYESLMHWASVAIATPIVIYSAEPFHRGAWRDLRHLTPGMDVPVSLAILAAWGLSVYHTILGRGDVYFDSVTMFTFFLLIGRFIEIGSRRRFQSSRLLSDNLMPSSALLADGSTRIAVQDIVPGQVLVVAPGESIPADGVIVEGATSVVESAFTGESKPVEKAAGARVLAGSDNLDGAIRIRATAGYADFVMSKISELYRQSTAYKPRFSMIADVVARYFVAFILLAAGLSGLGWYIAGSANWFSIGLSVLVVSCPCALSLATPVAHTVAVAAMRNSGIVIANGMFLERLAEVTRIVFDKTGTLTRGNLHIERVVTLADVGVCESLQIAAALELHSSHPVAHAFARETPYDVDDVKVMPGEGISGRIGGCDYRIGKPEFAGSSALQPPDDACTWVLLAGKFPLAWFGLSDEIRDEARSVVDRLKEEYSVSIMTGDTKQEATRLGSLLGIDDVAAGMSPADKVDRVRQMQSAGEKILMVGDGVNDAAALATAAASITVSPADIVVQEAADATLLHANLERIPLAISFARKVRRVIRENMTWAVVYNLVVIPMAVAGIIEPWMAALGMSASSVLVVLNANRLHRVS